MTRIYLNRNLVFRLNGQDYKLSKLVDKTWQAENIQTGILMNLRVDDLVNKYTTGEIQLPEIPMAYSILGRKDGEKISYQFDMLPEEEKSRAKFIRLFLEHYLTHYGDNRSLNTIRRAIGQDWPRITGDLPAPAPSTLYHWLRRYICSGKSILSLIERKGDRGNTTDRIHPKLKEFCTQAIEAIYLNENRGTKKQALRKATSLVDAENRLRPMEYRLPYPTLSTIITLIRQLPEPEVFAARYGKNAARHRYRASIGNAPAAHPLERWEIDHTQLNLIVVDSRTGLPIGRPWLTLVIDVYTRAIMGYHLTFNPPSHSSVAAALRFAMMPKAFLKAENPKLEGRWNMYGVPLNLVVDNGLEFHGLALENACYQLGITIAYCPRKTPWWKGTVERTLGTLNRAVTGLAPGGRTFDSITEKAEYDPVGTAMVSFEMLKEGIVRWIVDIYHETRHRSIDACPRDMWETTINPEDIPLPANPTELKAITGNIDSRRVWHYGIEINNLIYNSLELNAIRHTFKNKATIRWDPEDLGAIYVLVPDGGILQVPVIQSKSYAKGLSLYTYQMVRQFLTDCNKDVNNDIQIANCIEEIRQDFINDGKKMKKKTRVTQHRFNEGAPEPAATEQSREKPELIPEDFVEQPIPKLSPIFTERSHNHLNGD